MNFRQLRYFVAVAEERHFGRAAQRMFMSQPPLSIQIRHLEDELGVKLFDRHTRRVKLTDAGRTFLEYAYEILAISEQACQVAVEAQSGLRGRLAIGFISSATLTVLPPALRAFQLQYPAVTMDLKEISSGHQADALYKGTIQVGLLRLPLQAPGLSIEPLLRETLYVAMPEDHDMATLSSIPLARVAQHPLIFFNRQHIPGLHDQIQGLFHAIGATPNVAQYAVSLQTIIGLVASNIGLAIVPESSQRLHRDGIVYRRLDADNVDTWMAIAHLDPMNSQLVTHFKQTIYDVLPDVAHN